MEVDPPSGQNSSGLDRNLVRPPGLAAAGFSCRPRPWAPAAAPDARLILRRAFLLPGAGGLRAAPGWHPRTAQGMQCSTVLNFRSANGELPSSTDPLIN